MRAFKGERVMNVGKKLIYAEKPSVGKSIAAALETRSNRFKKANGYYESDEYVITWGFGHLVGSKQPSDYPEFTAQPGGGWDWSAIPFAPPGGALEYKENPGSIEQLRVVKQQFRRTDLEACINACDAGREGELIFWSVYHYSESKLPVRRLWITDLNVAPVLKGLDQLKEAAFYLPRKEAAYARQFADWFLGHNLTVAFTLKGREVSSGGGRTLHVGRVQTPTLAILVKRRQEIDQFQAETYYEVEAEFDGAYKGLWFKEQLGNTRLSAREEADHLAARIKGKTGEVTKKQVKEEQEHHPHLYNLSGLQKEANKKFGFGAKKVLDLAQVLYEKYGLLTYPRTSSQYLPESYVPELDGTLQAVQTGEWAPHAAKALESGARPTRRFVNDKEVSDHHAIIPTQKSPASVTFTDEKTKEGLLPAGDIARIYDLVVRRFLSVFFPPALYEKTEIVTEVGGETFKTSGKIQVQAGWKEVYGNALDEEEEEAAPGKSAKNEKKEKDTHLPPINLGDTPNTTQTEVKEKKTQAPKHYTQGELIGIMEKPKRLLADDDLKEALAEAGAGLGTEATRAGIIENIIARRYVEEQGKGKVKYLVATDAAVKLIQMAPEELKSPEITAQWEQRLKYIQEGELARETFEEGIKTFVAANIEALKTAKLNIDFNEPGKDDVVVGPCPVCQKPVVERKTWYICTGSTAEAFCFGIPKEVAGKKISPAQGKVLLTKGETAELKGFKSKAGALFSAKLVIKNGRVEFGFAERKSEPTGVPCPVCQADMIDHGAYWACAKRTKEKDCFAVNKTIAAKQVTEKVFAQLAEKGVTDWIDGFKSKAGKAFGARLKRDGIRVVFDFDSGLACPFCGGGIAENKAAFGCTNRQSGNCPFSVWKNGSKKLTLKQISKLIQTGKTDVLDDMQSKKGTVYAAFWELDREAKRVERRFPPR